MKAIPIRIFGLALLAVAPVCAQPYTNFIRQVQFPGATEYDMSVENSDRDPTKSQMPIDPGGARFELWTVNSVGPVSHLLSSTYVSTYMPIASVNIVTEDTTGDIPRTRADRPFQVLVTLKELLSGDSDPAASKSVNFYHHTQSYGEDGDGSNIDRNQATQLSQGSLTTNGDHPFPFAIHSVPSSNLAKACGEQRFSVFSLADAASGAPISELASQTVQIWPVADGSIAGLTNNQKIKFRMPPLTLTLNDLYPSSSTYLQAYKGAPALGTVGRVVPGSFVPGPGAVPLWQTVLYVDKYDEVVDSDGQWTFELVTSTPFGIDRLAYVTFEINRTLDIRSSTTTLK